MTRNRATSGRGKYEMRPVDADRRRLLVAAIALTSVASGSAGLRLSRAWAQEGADASPTTRSTAVRMARHLYPHTAIPDDVYAQVLDDVLAAAASDPSLESAIRDAASALDAQQPGDFLSAGDAGQLAAMRAVEHTEAFAAVLAAVRVRFYSHPAVWEVIGYEGPSYARGGYLTRGAGDIDWLPESR